jgi:tetratricopeptide (TPR) repeat protein
MTTETALPSKFEEIQEALKAKNRNKAARLLAEQAKELPEGVQHRLGLSQLAQQIGESTISRFFASHAVAADQGSANLLKAATLLADSGDLKGAYKIAQKVVTVAKDFAPGWNIKGTLEIQLGDREKAAESLDKAIFIQPRSAAHWLERAYLKTYTQEDEFVGKLFGAQQLMASTQEGNKALYVFALAKVAHDLGDYDTAWGAMQQANAMMSKVAPYDVEADLVSAQNILNTLSSDTFSKLKPSGDTSDRSIFIFGGLRSGATLVDRILVGSPNVVGGGSINLFALAAATLEEATPEKLVEIQSKYESPWRDMAVSYNHMIKSRFGAEGRVVDRTLSQSRLAPLIHHVLPNAPKIWVRRDINALAVSQYRICMPQGGRWSTNQASLAKHLALEEKLFQAIAPKMGDKLLIVNYEELVADPAGQSARILAHCGLANYEGAATPPRLTTPALTSSVFAGNLPIHANAVQPKEEYLSKMEEFKSAFAQEMA